MIVMMVAVLVRLVSRQSVKIVDHEVTCTSPRAMGLEQAVCILASASSSPSPSVSTFRTISEWSFPSVSSVARNSSRSSVLTSSKVAQKPTLEKHRNLRGVPDPCTSAQCV